MTNFDVEKAIAASLASKTDQEREEWEKFQNEQRAGLQLGDGRVLFGKRQVELAFNQLDRDDVDRDFEFERMAEGYALQGDFLRAYVLTTNSQKQKEYKQILDATEMDCLCSPSFKFVKDKYPQFTLYGCACGHLRKV